MSNVRAGMIADAMLISQSIACVTGVSGWANKEHATPEQAVLKAPQ